MSTILLYLSKTEDAGRLSAILLRERHNVITAENNAALNIYLRESPDMLIVDSSLKDDVFAKIKEAFPQKPILCYLQEHNARLAVEYMRAGASDCICASFTDAEVKKVIDHTMLSYYGEPEPSGLAALGKNPAKARSALAGAVALAALALWGVLMLARPSAARISLPYAHATSIVLSGKNAWIASWYTQTVYQYLVDKDKLNLVNSSYFADYGPMALASHDNALWTAGNDFILRQHAQNKNLDVINKFQLPKYTLSGMSFADNSLWLCGPLAGDICQYSIGQSVSPLNTYKTGVTNQVGPCWDGETMYVADTGNNTLCAFKKNGFGGLALMQRYAIPPAGTGTLSAIAAAGGKLFLLYDGDPSCVVVASIDTLRKTND